MALEEIQAISARMASLGQLVQQLTGTPAVLGTPLGANNALGPSTLSTPLSGNGSATNFGEILGRNVATSGLVVGQSSPSTVNTALQYASEQIGDPYVFGANGPDAWDCSSLVQAAYQQAGIALPRTAAEQAQAGTAVAVDRDAIRPGDLVFMHGGSPPHDLGHVGIAISADQFIVAPHSGEKVQVQSIPWSRVQRIRRVTPTNNESRPAAL
jgi:cell wall-associated NlpC family hydrolase